MPAIQTSAMADAMQRGSTLLPVIDTTSQKLSINPQLTMQAVQGLVCPLHLRTCRWLAILFGYDVDNAENIRRPWEALYNEDGSMKLVCYAQGHCHSELQQARVLLLHVLVQLG